jgi:hypothetical protein
MDAQHEVEELLEDVLAVLEEAGARVPAPKVMLGIHSVACCCKHHSADVDSAASLSAAF